MSGILDLIDQRTMSLGPPAENTFTDFTDVVGATFEETFRNFGSMSQGLSESLEMSDNFRRYRAVSGGTHLVQDAINWIGDEKEIEQIRKETNNGDIRTPRLLELMDEYVLNMQHQYPDKFKDILTRQQITDRAKEKAVESKRVAEETRAGATGFDATVGSLVGGVAAGFTDPINLATMVMGAPLASGIFKTMLFEAGVNVGAEIAVDPFVASWQKELGEEYGLSERLTNLTVAGLFGAGVGGFTKFMSRAFGSSKALAARYAQSAAEEGNRIDDALSAHFVSRDFYLKEAQPKGIDVDTHFRLVNEMEASIREGRSPRLQDILPDLETRFRGDYANDIHRDLELRLKEAQGDVSIIKTKRADINMNPDSAIDKPPTVGDNYLDPHRPELDNEKLLAEMYDSDEFIAREQRLFDEAVERGLESGKFKKDSIVFRDEDGVEINGVKRTDLTLEEMQEHFADNKKAIQAISACGLGGK